MLSLLLATGGVGQYVSGAFSDRFGRKKVLIILSLACAACSLPIPIVSNVILIVLILILGFILLGLIPTTNALMSDLAKGSFGVLFGVYYLFAFGVSSAGPPIAGLLAENFGLGSIWYFSAMIALICFVITLFIPVTTLSEQKG